MMSACGSRLAALASGLLVADEWVVCADYSFFVLLLESFVLKSRVFLFCRYV